MGLFFVVIGLCTVFERLAWVGGLVGFAFGEQGE